MMELSEKLNANINTKVYLPILCNIPSIFLLISFLRIFNNYLLTCDNFSS